MLRSKFRLKMQMSQSPPFGGLAWTLNERLNAQPLLENKYRQILLEHRATFLPAGLELIYQPAVKNSHNTRLEKFCWWWWRVKTGSDFKTILWHPESRDLLLGLALQNVLPNLGAVIFFVIEIFRLWACISQYKKCLNFSIWITVFFFYFMR